MFNTLYTKKFDLFERPSHSTDTPVEMESDAEALRGLVTMAVNASEITDKPRAIQMLASDGLVQQRFLKNEFQDNDNHPMDPTEFLVERFNVLDNSVGHTLSRPKPEDMVTASESWHTDNMDSTKSE